jgi:hypothetical protein
MGKFPRDSIRARLEMGGGAVTVCADHQLYILLLEIREREIEPCGSSL